MISEVPSKTPIYDSLERMLFSIPSLFSGKSLFLADIQVSAFKHKYSLFSVFTIAVFHQGTVNTELQNTNSPNGSTRLGRFLGASGYIFIN